MAGERLNGDSKRMTMLLFTVIHSTFSVSVYMNLIPLSLYVVESIYVRKWNTIINPHTLKDVYLRKNTMHYVLSLTFAPNKRRD